MLAGALAIVVAVAIPAIDGGELNRFRWTVMAVTLLSGIALAVTALVLATSHRSHRLASPNFGKRVVIICDEAQPLDHDQLEELRLLLDGEMDSRSPFACLLVDQPTLRHRNSTASATTSPSNRPPDPGVAARSRLILVITERFGDIEEVDWRMYLMREHDLRRDQSPSLCTSSS